MSILRVGVNWHFDCASCPKMLWFPLRRVSLPQKRGISPLMEN
jgi:hypothetical protein